MIRCTTLFSLSIPLPELNACIMEGCYELHTPLSHNIKATDRRKEYQYFSFGKMCLLLLLCRSYLNICRQLYQAEHVWQWQQLFPAERWHLPQPKNEQELKLGPRTPSIDLASSFQDPNPTNYPQESQNKPNTKRSQPITHRIQMISCQHPSAWHSRHPPEVLWTRFGSMMGLTQY